MPKEYPHTREWWTANPLGAIWIPSLAGLDSIQKIVEAAGNREDSLEAVDIQPF